MVAVTETVIGLGHSVQAALRGGSARGDVVVLPESLICYVAWTGCLAQRCVDALTAVI